MRILSSHHFPFIASRVACLAQISIRQALARSGWPPGARDSGEEPKPSLCTLSTPPNLAWTGCYYASPQKSCGHIHHGAYSSRWSGYSLFTSPHRPFEYRSAFLSASLRSRYRHLNSKARWQNYYRLRLVMAYAR